MTGCAPPAAYRAASGSPISRPALWAAQAAFVVGVAYAAVSVYRGLGGSWLLDTVGGTLETAGGWKRRS